MKFVKGPSSLILKAFWKLYLESRCSTATDVVTFEATDESLEEHQSQKLLVDYLAIYNPYVPFVTLMCSQNTKVIELKRYSNFIQKTKEWNK